MSVLLEGVVGSTAYGLAGVYSDVDFLACHLEPTRSFLGFGLHNDQLTRVTNNPDHTSHEISKWLKLALKGNPTVLELVWLNEYTVLSDLGQELINMRKSLLCSTHVINAYVGYAAGQAKSLLRNGKFPDLSVSRVAKNARHCFRLLVQGEELLRTGNLTIRLDDETVAKTHMMGLWATEAQRLSTTP